MGVLQQMYVTTKYYKRLISGEVMHTCTFTLSGDLSLWIREAPLHRKEELQTDTTMYISI